MAKGYRVQPTTKILKCEVTAYCVLASLDLEMCHPVPAPTPPQVPALYNEEDTWCDPSFCIWEGITEATATLM